MADTKRWRVIRIPESLGQRIDALTAQLQGAHSEGRVAVPNELADRIPPWYTIQHALDEQESRRARSNRPRSKQPQA